MKSDTYETRRKNINFYTKEISIRGFTRELKLLLLNDQDCCLLEPQYSKVASAFEDQFKNSLVEKLPKMILSPEDKLRLKKYSFIEESGFSKWWTGTNYPGEAAKFAIDFLFPGLIRKWFNRTEFKNRMQLHLASLDLFHLSRSCNCKVEENLKLPYKTQCDTCLNHAMNEASWILESIHKEWTPEPSGYLKRFDICISGPKKRSV